MSTPNLWALVGLGWTRGIPGGEWGSTKSAIALTISSIFLYSCASSPEDIETSYVSTLQYQDYNCRQIAIELDQVSRRAGELEGSLESKANTDKVQMGVGLILFWPTLFFLEGGDGPAAQEYSRLKGERIALEKVANMKGCSTLGPGATAAAVPYSGQTTYTTPVVQPVAMTTYGVRFGAYQSPDGAQQGWADIWSRHWQQLSGVQPQMVTSQASGGAPQYHLYGMGLTKERA